MINENIMVAAQRTEMLTKFIQAITQAQLHDTLEYAGPFTLFAPVDSAFEKISELVFEHILKKPSLLEQMVALHIVPGIIPSHQFAKQEYLKTVEGIPVKLDFFNDTFHYFQASIIKADIEASNGIIHLIDTVILPPRT